MVQPMMHMLIADKIYTKIAAQFVRMVISC